MSLDIFSLLTLGHSPSTSTVGAAFSAYKSSNPVQLQLPDESAGSASPVHVHKVARLDSDSDSASASRSRAGEAAATTRKRGVAQVKITGSAYRPSDRRQSTQSGFTDLQRCIINILSLDEPTPRHTLPYERIFSTCLHLVCAAGRGQDLEDVLKLELEKSLARLRGQLVGKETKGEMEWVEYFVRMCRMFEGRIRLLQNLLAYLDRVYMIEIKGSEGIENMAYGLFTEAILERESGIVQRIKKGIEEWVTAERLNPDTPHPSRPTIQNLIAHLHRHARYEPIFESFYLSLLASFYTAESSKLAAEETRNAREFIVHCDARIAQEMKRAEEVLPKSSWAIVRSRTEYALLEGRGGWLAQDGMKALMNKRDMDGLKRMYNLFDRINGKKDLLVQFKNTVQDTVKRIVEDQPRDDEMVSRLISFKHFATTTLSTSFASSPDFNYALQDAFTTGFKCRRLKPAEMIAKHVDRLLRQGQAGREEAEYKKELEDVLGLYRSTDDKDVFRTFYQRALAKRLLLKRAASDDVEKAMLDRLKKDYDPEFGMGDQMFTDLNLSRDLGKDYRETLAGKNNNTDSDLVPEVMILQASVWPFTSRKGKITAVLPPYLQEQLTSFTAYYKSKYKGRTLEWDHSLGTATLEARFPKGTKRLTVSLYQAVVLLLFNEEKELGFGEIKVGAGMEDAELRRTLQSLACGKKKVLTKRPAGKDVNDGDVFVFNEKFTDPKPVVHINSIQSKETAEETTRTRNAIEGDRKHLLDAAIVRLMKAKKQMHHGQIVNETVQAVQKHFVPSVAMIKERIASLTEAEYVRRDEEDMGLYIYVA
ncbi:Cullin-domain-containing protein [Stereum hirsutum FP-91666 SS1]|uniref:Cullin-domain-containing protein n=1 Tax=Stereum hirsutum (strain FP-91666) TaxID=721885 RepID=UPI000440C020|nr:Cullin-domain-containing protein [Stereum hirsutum FP-91666 SS1]EIM91856.1 Cullin-domain-containing protein [Stereum hirsutum FP-91666 SS1]